MKVEGIILAAGLSSRIGKNKMILDIGGKTVIDRCIEGMYGVCSRIIVVGGHRTQDIKYIIDQYEKVELVYNPDYLEGMFSSVMKGVAQVRGQGVFLIPGDYPAVKKTTYKDILGVDKDIVVPLYNKEKGHPLFMKYPLVKELLASNAYQTLRDFVNKKGYTPIDVVDPGILMDIDTIDDYKKICLYQDIP